MSYIAYYRVSTDRQGKSGLGLDAQKTAVLAFLNGQTPIAEYVEVESGRKKNRPQLTAALATAKKQKATLVIAKLDRLARNVAFISSLMESGVDFVAADMPNANRLTVHILAAVAEHEREMISQRTKAALAVAKKRGVRLGKTGIALAKHNRDIADDRAKTLKPIIEELTAAGITSRRGLAEALNQRGVKTPMGAKWHPTSIQRTLDRL